MNADPVRDYLEARNAVEQAAENVQRLIRTIAEAVGSLSDWRNVTITHTPYRTKTEGYTTDSRRFVDPWPTANQVAEALGAWHQAKQGQHSTFDRVAEDVRQGLVPPLV